MNLECSNLSGMAKLVATAVPLATTLAAVLRSHLRPTTSAPIDEGMTHRHLTLRFLAVAVDSETSIICICQCHRQCGCACELFRRG